MTGGPANSSRGRGGKFKKYTRGGGKHFSRDLQPVDADGNKVSMWSADAQKRGEDEEEEDDEDSEEEEDSDDAGPSKPATTGEESRDDRKAQKKARKEAAVAKASARTVEVGDMPSSDEDDSDDDMPANPNHSKAARNQAAGTSASVEAITDGVQNLQSPSRRERESMDAAAAKEKYMKLHTQGKTDEAKADLARLKIIREQRAAEAARRQAEKEEKEAQDKERKAEIDAKEAKRREAAAGPKKGKKK